MDIFEVLSAILKRKKTFIYSGINELEALKKAEIDVSNEYHISLLDIKKLVGIYSIGKVQGKARKTNRSLSFQQLGSRKNRIEEVLRSQL